MDLGAWESVQERRLLVFYRRTRRIFATALLRVYQVVGIHLCLLVLQLQPYLSATKYGVGASNLAKILLQVSRTYRHLRKCHIAKTRFLKREGPVTRLWL